MQYFRFNFLQVVIGQIEPFEVLGIEHDYVEYGSQIFDRSDFVIVQKQTGTHNIDLLLSFGFHFLVIIALSITQDLVFIGLEWDVVVREDVWDLNTVAWTDNGFFLLEAWGVTLGVGLVSGFFLF